nr:MAG TPA: hypothetical protein [Caudoviricetes sp.]
MIIRCFHLNTSCICDTRIFIILRLYNKKNFQYILIQY